MKLSIHRSLRSPRIAALAGMLLAVTLSTVLQARQINSWPYDRLRSEADLIVIAEAKASVGSGEIVHGSLWQTDFIGINTTFTVTGVIKGRHTGPELILHHLGLRDDVILQNPPFLAEIKLTPVLKSTPAGIKKIAQPEYLLFLKKLKDGRFEPASGPLESAHAIRELQLPLEGK